MVNILDIVNAGGKLRTAAGWDVDICYVNKEVDHCICGYVSSPNGMKNLHKWDKDGKPQNLPLTHGLNLIPVVPITTYHMIDPKQMKQFDKVQDLMNSEIKRISG